VDRSLIIELAVLLAAFVYLAWREREFRREREAERAEFAAERREWRAERRDLNNRIQVPEAAPFMEEEPDRPEDAEDDLPVLPAGTVDEASLERAREELEAVGYSEGPVA
jgi:hypothetical protein